jgi:hypothetical protein
MYPRNAKRFKSVEPVNPKSKTSSLRSGIRIETVSSRRIFSSILQEGRVQKETLSEMW